MRWDLLSVAGERGELIPPVDGSAIGLDPVLRRRRPSLAVPRLEPVGREAVPFLRREGALPLLRHLRGAALGAVGDPGAKLILDGGSGAVLSVDVHGVVLRMSGSVARLSVV